MLQLKSFRVTLHSPRGAHRSSGAFSIFNRFEIIGSGVINVTGHRLRSRTLSQNPGEAHIRISILLGFPGLLVRTCNAFGNFCDTYDAPPTRIVILSAKLRISTFLTLPLLSLLMLHLRSGNVTLAV